MFVDVVDTENCDGATNMALLDDKGAYDTFLERVGIVNNL
jgi:hypothetical protein